jgi:branched-chain amino acid transport system substrate-binding protein
MSTFTRRILLAAAPAAALLAWPLPGGSGGARAQPPAATPQAPAANGTAPSAAELRFGALFPLSGPQAQLGDEAFRGLEIAAEERIAAGGVLGRPVRLLRTDVTEPAQAGAEAKRLATLPAAERPFALFGTLDTQLSLAASQAAELQGLPYLELTAAGDAVTERGFRLLFRTAPRTGEYARAALEAVAPLAALLGLQEAAVRIGVLHADAPGAEALGTLLEARIREQGMTLAERAGYVAQQPAEIAAAVRRLRTAEAQVILHAAGRGGDGVALFRALADESWKPKGGVVGLGGGYMLRETAQTLGAAFEGTLVADLPQPQVDERFAPGLAGFAEAYKRRYGADMRSGHSAACYAGALVFFGALQRSGAADAAKFRAAVLATDVAERALANGWGARFEERSGQNQRACAVLQQWRDGRLLAVRPAEAGVAPVALPPA